METINTMLATPCEMTIDFDHMDALLGDGCWLETTDHGSNFWQRGVPVPTPSNFSLSYLPSSGTNLGYFNPNPYQLSFEDETEISKTHDCPPLDYPPSEKLDEVTGSGRRFLTGPHLIPNTSVKKRLVQAIEYLKESTRDRDVLIQMWLPESREGKHVLTTHNQPFVVNSNCKNLADYRVVSSRYQFAAEEDSKEFPGLPGRVFLKKLPECTPDVRFFKEEEYARVNFAQQFNVSGSLAIPVFEQASGTCLGVVEIVTTAQQVNYGPELDNICKALEAVDLRSSKFLIPPKAKDCNESYQAALAEIQEVLQSVCDTHNLPLAQTWAPCTQQGEAECHRSVGNHASCVSIVESACYVFDPKILAFHEACCEHHLLRGEGVAGGAFLTNQPCFATDITAFSKTEYPLSHHARIFKLCGAVAIRLRSIYTGSADFVLEFFLPLDCKEDEEQKQMLSSLSAVIQQVCRSLRVITEEELEEETSFIIKGMTSPLVDSQQYTQDESSWISHMIEAQREGKGVSVSLGCHKEEPEEEFKVTNAIWPTFFEGEKIIQKDVGPKCEAQEDYSSIGPNQSLGARKAGERRRVKTERNISLQVLRQYFPGSLKDAAKSIGVCPTTLKRICRQHGITRWPSRKIKKVGHSLRKLQLVIDSVQGTEGAIQLSSFYTNFPELSSPTIPSTNAFSISKLTDPPQGSVLSPGTHSSSPSHSSGSSLCNSTGDKEPSMSVSAFGTRNALLARKPDGMLNRACSDAELHELSQEETNLLVRSQSHNFTIDRPFEALPPFPKSTCQILRDGSAFRVKASFGEEKIRLSLPQHWGFQHLQKEIVTRFKLDDLSNISLKYLDDDSEWVLLTCDADLEECIDIHRSSSNRTIKLSLHQTCHPDLGSSFNKSGLS